MKRVEKSRILFLDVGPITKLLQFDAEDYPVISRVLDLAYEKQIQMVVSPTTFFDVATAAYSREPLLARQYKEFFTRSANMAMREIDADVAMAAAELRSKFSLSFEESLQLGVAHVAGADTIFTLNDAWKNYTDATVVTVEDLRVSY